MRRAADTRNRSRAPRARRSLSVGAVMAVIALLAGCGATDSLPTSTGTGQGTDVMTAEVDTTFTDTTDTTFTDTTSTVSVPPATYADAVSLVDDGTSLDGTDTFSSSGSDIYCVVGDTPDVTACETSGTRFPPPAGECAFPDGPKDVGRVQFGEDGRPEAICNSDTTRSGPPAPRAETGDVVSSPSGDRECVTTEGGGVVCIDRATETAFFIDGDGYRLIDG